MLTNLDPDAASFLADTNRIQKRISVANSQVSSGKKVQVASDAPDQIGGILQLRSDQQRNTQIQSNLALAATDANAADTALSSAIQLMDTAITLATQGSNAIVDDSVRQNLAQQVQAIQQQMVAFSQTTVEGRYIFSGDQDGTATYEYQSGASNPAVLLARVSSNRLVEDPAGGSFAAAKTAQQIFDDSDPVSGAPAEDNVFAALNTLQQMLTSNDIAGLTNSISALRAASEHLNSMQSFYGNVQTRVTNASDYATSYDVQLQTQLSQKEDADVTAAALEMTQANTELQAAFQMRAQRPHNSLFSFLG